MKKQENVQIFHVSLRDNEQYLRKTIAIIIFLVYNDSMIERELYRK